MQSEEIEKLQSEIASIKKRLETLERSRKPSITNGSALHYLLIAIAVGFALVMSMPLISASLTSKFEDLSHSIPTGSGQ
jgi:hypothetical protein